MNIMPAEGGSASGGKIAVIHSIYKPYTRGGAEVVVENIVIGLKNEGHDVFVVSVGFSMAYLYTGSLWAPVCMHAIFNGVNLALLYVVRPAL